MNTKELHHYCIMRPDLPLGVFAAQLIHVAGESNPKSLHAKAVALYSKSLEHLLELEKKIINKNISHISVRESDGGWDNQLMGIGIFPCVRDESLEIRQIVAGLKLIK